jgi:hypothetical protein
MMRAVLCRSLLVVAALGLPAWVAAQSAISGVVRDSLTGRPFAGAVVQLLPAAAPWEAGATTQSDSTGRYRFADVVPGRYQLGFHHPRLDSLGFDAVSRVLDVGTSRSAADADLALPSASTLAGWLCGIRRDTTGVVLGRVLDAGTELPRGAGEVIVEWGEMVLDSLGLHPARASIRAAVGADGRFVACGVPTNVPVLLRAVVADSIGRASSGTIEVTFADSVPLRHRDLLLAPEPRVAEAPASRTGAVDSGGSATSTPNAVQRGTSSVVGRVLAPGGQPLSGARVRLRDARVTEAFVTTDSGGRFRMTGLPAGTYPIEVIAIGFTPTRVSVDLRPARVAQANITIRARVATLEAVTVYSPRSREAVGFDRRRLQKRGYFLTGEQIRARGVLLSFVLLSAPSIRVVDVRYGRPVLRGFGKCMPTVYLDGFPVTDDDADDLDRLISVNEIGGVEVYTTTFEAPAQFGRPPIRDRRSNLDGTCASIVLWSRMLVP